MEKLLKSPKWNLWYSNGHRARQRVEDLKCDFESMKAALENKKKLPKAVRAFSGYLSANSASPR